LSGSKKQTAPGERAGKAAAKGGEGPLRQLADLDVVILAPEDDDIAALVRELQRAHARVRRIWPLPDLFPVEADMVICDLSPGLAQRLPWLPGQAPLAFVLLVPAQREADLAEMMNCAPHGVLSRPVTVSGALAGLLLARSQALYEQRLRSRIDKLDDNLRTMRLVEQAKSILMRQKNVSEDEAYRFLRQQAMVRRVSIGALAGVVVDSHELLG
jgi:AmiR/NasT family two-component response regulator